MDRIGANFFGVLEEMKTKLGTTPVPLQLPMGAESDFEGVVDLVEMRETRWSQEDQGLTIGHAPIDVARQEEARKWRENLVDHVSHLSDELTELYVAGNEIPVALLRTVIRKAVLTRAFTPVLCGASLRNVGVQPVLDAVVDFLPSPPTSLRRVGTT